MKIGFLLINGKDMREMSQEELTNVRKRVASHIRTHEPDSVDDLWHVVRTVAQCYGEYVTTGGVEVKI